jgi:hypothetical protein
MSTAPILPFRLKSWDMRSSWTGATETVTEEDHGLVRLEADRLVVQLTKSRKIRKASAMGSVETVYEQVPLKEFSIALADLQGVSLRVPTWRFWEKPRVVFHVSEMRVLEGLPSTGPAEFSVPITASDKAVANDFVVRCSGVLAKRLPPLPVGSAASLP